MRHVLLLLLAAAPTLAACDGTEPDSGCPASGRGTLTATVDGQAFTATCVVTGTTEDGIGVIADDRSTLPNPVVAIREISFDVPREVRSNPVGGSANALAFYTLRPPTGGAPVAFAADSGAVVVESITGSRYRGRFSFRTGSAAAPTHTVTNGRFDVVL